MIVVDTGPIVALLNDRDDHHVRCRDFLAHYPGPLLVPTTVFTMLESTSADLDRIAELVEKYADVPLGTVDASVIALAERLDLPAVTTLDHRHFGVVRPCHVEALALLP